MSLGRGSEQSITDQLSQAIKKMGDFLLKDSKDLFDELDELEYKKLYEEIGRLTVKAKLEGYFDYEHKNKYKTLKKFLSNRNFEELIIKYYSVPSLWRKVLIRQSKIQKIIKNGKKFFEWFVKLPIIKKLLNLLNL